MKRYTDFPMPARRYLPGEGMHPDKDPSGSHIPELPGTSMIFDEHTWRDSDRYLYSLDLFNHGYWWEAHEVLEGLWNETGRTTPIALFLQGLIQICAALLKETQSMHAGALRLTERGVSKLNTGEAIFFGIDVNRLIDDLTSFLDGERSDPPVIRLVR